MSATSYDVVAYPSHPLPQTHPDRLAAIGILLGLSPAPVERCRVLELGCGEGGNIIPMGLSYPQSSFTGLDLAETAIDVGMKFARELEIVNVELQTADLLEFPTDAGQFDYIIAHGLYSWVPAIVRDKIMAVCRDHLAPQGIAYISYNTLPGCHVRRMLRDMMRFHVRDIADPRQKIEQARSFLNFLTAGKAKENDPYAQLLKAEQKWSGLDKAPEVLFHDDLAEINDPCYFHEFATHAAAHELQFLAEADYYEMSDVMGSPEVTAVLRDLGEKDAILREQYLDYIKCRRFRQSLLVRKEVAIQRKPSAERIRGLSISSRAKAVTSRPNLAKGVKESFREQSGGAITIDLPLAKAALLHLGEVYPLPVRFDELMAAARSRPGMPADAGDDAAVGEILLACFTIGLVELHAGPATFVRHAGPKPLASPLVRQQLRHGIDLVTTLRHTPVRIDNPLSCALISMLDGSRDRATLLTDLVKWARANPAPGLSPPPEGELRERLGGQIDTGLESAAAMALLLS